MSTRLKICGIKNQQDATACIELGVDLLGFNFYSGSPRFISFENAHSIIREIPSATQSVGILVRPRLVDVLEAIEQSGVEVVQIFEPQDFSDFSQITVPVIIVKRIADTASDKYELNGAMMILLDTYTPGKLGGSGKVFDWSLIPDSIPRERLVLGGGISPDNVKDALDQVKPAVIDVASGAESAPGKKDLVKVKLLIEAIRRK
ncbi:MAG: phosphoribosylanthranilate isomerase [Calditrichia bacterium]